MSKNPVPEPLLAAGKAVANALNRRARVSVVAGVVAMLLGGLAMTASTAMLAFAVTPGVDEGAATSLMFAVGLGVLAQGLDVLKWRCHADAELRLEQALTQSTFERGIRSQIGHGVGGEMQALANALLGCRLLFQHLVFTAPTAIVATVTSATLLVGLGYLPVAIAMLLFAPVYLLSAIWRAMPMVRVANRASRARIETGRKFGDALANREVIRAFRAERFVGAALNSSLRRVVRFTGLLATLRACAAGLSVFVYGAGLSAVMWLAWGSAATSSERVTLLVLASVSMASLMRPMEMAAGAFRDLIWARALVMPLVAPTNMRTNEAEVTTAPVAVRMDKVSIAYKRDRYVLNDASLFCPAGSRTGLSGDSGAGKSTVIRLLTGEVQPDAGAASLGHECAPGRPSISVALQEVLLLDDTVRENIAFGRATSDEEIRRVLTLVGLDPLIKSLPAGLESRVGERGMRLSGGERQRVALARAMLKPAALYLFDEATSALQPEAEGAVMARIVESIGEATMIVVAHRETAFVGMDRVIELRGGAFIEPPSSASLANARIDRLSRAMDLQNPVARI